MLVLYSYAQNVTVNADQCPNVRRPTHSFHFHSGCHLHSTRSLHTLITSCDESATRKPQLEEEQTTHKWALYVLPSSVWYTSVATQPHYYNSITITAQVLFIIWHTVRTATFDSTAVNVLRKKIRGRRVWVYEFQVLKTGNMEKKLQRFCIHALSVINCKDRLIRKSWIPLGTQRWEM